MKFTGCVVEINNKQVGIVSVKNAFLKSNVLEHYRKLYAKLLCVNPELLLMVYWDESLTTTPAYYGNKMIASEVFRRYSMKSLPWKKYSDS